MDVTHMVMKWVNPNNSKPEKSFGMCLVPFFLMIFLNTVTFFPYAFCSEMFQYNNHGWKDNKKKENHQEDQRPPVAPVDVKKEGGREEYQTEEQACDNHEFDFLY